MIDQRRMRLLNSAPPCEGPVVYWMSRDQRVQDNWALLMAEQIAHEQKQPMAIVFCLVPGFLGATIRQYGFLLRGLEELEKACRVKQIPFFLLMGSPEELLPAFVKKWKVGTLVCDFDPLRVKRVWKDKLVSHVKIPVLEVDAHNVVPCWVASPKQEFGAYTIRPKIKKLLPEFLTEFSAMRKPAVGWPQTVPEIDWKRVWKSLEVNQEIGEVDWVKPGEKAAHQALKAFLQERLGKYDEDRNDPTKQGQSDLSPYLHFGQLSTQRVALAVREYKGVSSTVKEAFLEELIVRRELADNFCWYQKDYDSVAGFPFWAQKTLGEHRQDEREFVYSQKEFERAETHDPLWNAAQQQMMHTGKMHGFMRMYWAKKILEWTEKPEDAMKIAIYLNDTYELDGRDPNGYAGIAWSIGGVHDRAWASRKVFGMIRYMNFNGCKRKFDVEAYIKRWGG